MKVSLTIFFTILSVPLICLTAAGAVAAAETELSVDEQARNEFEKGNTLFNDERFEDAATAFRNAYQLKPSWKIWYNIAQSEAAAKKYDLALEAFEFYLAEAGDEISDEKAWFVLNEIKKLKSRVGMLSFDLPDNVEIQIDGVVKGVTPLAGQLKVVAGKTHQLRLLQDGDVLLERKIKVGSQETLPIDLERTEEDDALPMDDDPNRDKSKSERDRKYAIIGWSLVGAGAALTLGGTILGIAAMSRANDIEERCPGNICRSQSDIELRESGQHLGVAANIFIGAGLTAAAAGTIFLILKRRQRQESIADRSEKNVIGWQLSPMGIGGTF